MHSMIPALRSFLLRPSTHACVLTAVIAIVLLRSHAYPLDDHFQYQKFIETLAQGRLDLSIPGFHGASFLALPLYLLTRSPLANIHFQMLCALLLLPAAALAARSLLRDAFQQILFLYAFALLPFYFFVALRGFTFPSFTLGVLLTLWLRGRGSAWAWIPWSVSLLIKPFSIALLPLFLLWQPTRGKNSSGSAGKSRSRIGDGWMQIGCAAVLPLLYFGAQYLQIGHLIIGAHESLDQSNVFQWMRLPLNALHGVQMLFSVHNFYFVDPAKTGLGNLTHSSPILLLLGLLSLLYPADFWKDRRLAGALLLSAVLAFLLAAALDHMDHFYLETCVLLLTLASIPAIAKYRLLLPLALVTLHFQFFYLYLEYRGHFFADASLFWIPAVADAMAILCCLLYVLPFVTMKSCFARWKKE